MTLNQSALLQITEARRTADGGDAMRQMLGFMLQALVDAEATAVIGAGPHERSEERVTHRNGSRAKTVSTTAGDLSVRIPKLRQGSIFPTVLEPRRRVDVALHAVVMEAYVHGVSTRKVDDLVTAVPRTLTGKRLEVPVTRVLQGEPAAQVQPGAITHPEMLARLEQHARERA